jgi:hypothetical protein
MHGHCRYCGVGNGFYSWQASTQVELFQYLQIDLFEVLVCSLYCILFEKNKQATHLTAHLEI